MKDAYCIVCELELDQDELIVGCCPYCDELVKEEEVH